MLGWSVPTHLFTIVVEPSDQLPAIGRCDVAKSNSSLVLSWKILPLLLLQAIFNTYCTYVALRPTVGAKNFPTGPRNFPTGPRAPGLLMELEPQNLLRELDMEEEK
jgi:hypothetical protein